MGKTNIIEVLLSCKITYYTTYGTFLGILNNNSLKVYRMIYVSQPTCFKTTADHIIMYDNNLEKLFIPLMHYSEKLRDIYLYLP